MTADLFVALLAGVVLLGLLFVIGLEGLRLAGWLRRRGR